MPHVIADVSECVFTHCLPQDLVSALHKATCDSNLFEEANIKVRLAITSHSHMAGKPASLVHVVIRPMPGKRTDSELAQLTALILERLEVLLPKVPALSAEVIELSVNTYVKRIL